MMKSKIAIIGCGRVGTCLAVFLSKSGYHIEGYFSKTIESAEKTSKAAGHGNIFKNTADAVCNSNIIFITTPDNIIEKVCNDIASQHQNMSGKTIFHCSGALSSKILYSAESKGANVGSIHPLQSFALYKKDQPSPFKDINISVEGNLQALNIGKELVEKLNANYFSIPTEAKILYHASAVVASNYLVTLENFALELLKEADISEKKAYEILEPLIKGTLNNIKERGATAALTGPIARGDCDIVEKHLKDIDKIRPEFLNLYKTMGTYTIDIAKKRGELKKHKIDKLASLFL